MISGKDRQGEAMESEDPLMHAFQLRHLTLKNRIMSTSHTMLYAVDGAPQQRYQLYHEEKARGGIALTMFGGSSNVSPDSAAATGVINLTSDSVIPHVLEFTERIPAPPCTRCYGSQTGGRDWRWTGWP